MTTQSDIKDFQKKLMQSFIDTALDAEMAKANLEHFDETWGEKYPNVVKFWRNNWEGLTVFFSYPKDTRKVIYTTNAIELLNSVVRTAVNKRKVFPSDQTALNVVSLATQKASKK